MATSIAASRESRRRKILDRGAHRLALITGQAQNFQSQSRDKPDSDSSQPLNSHLHRQDPSPHLSSQILASPYGGEEGFSSILPTSDSIIDAGHGGNTTEPSSDMLKTSAEALRTPASDVDSNEQSLLVSSTDLGSTVPSSTVPSSSRMQNLEQLHRNRFVTPSLINSAISATEGSRLFCSIIIALFVVLSYLSFPLLGSNIVKSMLSFRPLYLVLLTNLTLVLARLIFNNQRGSDRIFGGENNVPSTSRYDWAEQAGKVLELGLVMQKAIDAVVMDCSIYAIIVIAGISFVR